MSILTQDTNTCSVGKFNQRIVLSKDGDLIRKELHQVVDVRRAENADADVEAFCGLPSSFVQHVRARAVAEQCDVQLTVVYFEVRFTTAAALLARPAACTPITGPP